MATQFMFGRSLLVCPVLKPMYYEAESTPLDEEKTWKVYLPAGTSWYDFYTGVRYDGGQEILADAPLDTMPLYVRAGSVIPMTSGLQYAMEKNDAPLDDAGNDYAYEQGEYAQIPLHYDEAAGTLTIGERTGSYRGMEGQIRYEVYVSNVKKTQGVYDGAKVEIALNDTL